jgi:hypothetical protein
MRVLELTEQHFVSIMLELLRMKAKGRVGLEGIEGRMERKDEGGREAG